MTDFFVWRSCDLSGTGARDAVQQTTDTVNRAIALLEAPGGLPADEGTTATNPPELEIISATWCQITDGGQLTAGTYFYKLVPINICTGATGTSIPLPPLTVTNGQRATLCVTFNMPPGPCISTFIQRDGVVISDPLPINVQNQVPAVSSPDLNGTFVGGTSTTFTRATGADLVVGDLVTYQNKSVRVKAVAGDLITIDPPIVADPPATPDGFFSLKQRTGIYFNINPLPVLVGTISFPTPFMGFKTLIIPGLLATPQPGDLITYGSKTAIVIAVQPSLLPPVDCLDVAVIPFGLLPIPPLPFGTWTLVSRPLAPYIPSLGLYESLDLTPVGAPQHATGSITLTGLTGADLVDTDNFILNDGINAAVTYQFDSTGSLVSTPTLRYVPYTQAGTFTADNIRDAIITAVTATPTLTITATSGGPALVNLQNNNTGTAENQPITNNVANPGFVATGMAGGTSGTYDKFIVEGDPTHGGAPVDPAVVVGAHLWINGRLVKIITVENATLIDGSPDGSHTHARVTFDNGFAAKDDVTLFPLGHGLPDGPYVILPSALDSMYIQPSTITPAGAYQRLSRVVSITTANNQWQWADDGSQTARTGTVGVAASSARMQLDQVFTQAGYPLGLTNLFDKVRGPNTTQTNITFNRYLGHLIQPTGATRLYPTNATANLGLGPTIDLDSVRSLHALTCNDAAALNQTAVTTLDQGVSVLRLAPTPLTTPPAPCPPGQPATLTTQLVCNGLATTTVPLKPTENARVFWGPGARFTTGTQAKLVALGLTPAEARAALNLELNGRVLDVSEFSLNQTLALSDLSSLPPAQANEVLADTRVHTIDLGPLQPIQLQRIISDRGRAGITPNPTTRIPDFSLLATNTAAGLLAFPTTFDVCDFTTALATITDPHTRQATAAFFAWVESALSSLTTAGQALTRFLTDGPFSQAIDTIAGLTIATAADPTLSCLLGPANQTAQLPGLGLPNIPSIDLLVQQFALAFQQRFSLTQIYGQALSSLVCVLTDAVLKLLALPPTNPLAPLAQGAQRIIGCLPSRTELANLGFAFPSLDVEIAFDCVSNYLQQITTIITALIAEANECIDLVNSFKSGAPGSLLAAAEATNKGCSPNQAASDLTSTLANALGLPIPSALLNQVPDGL